MGRVRVLPVDGIVDLEVDPILEVTLLKRADETGELLASVGARAHRFVMGSE